MCFVIDYFVLIDYHLIDRFDTTGSFFFSSLVCRRFPYYLFVFDFPLLLICFLSLFSSFFLVSSDLLLTVLFIFFFLLSSLLLDSSESHGWKENVLVINDEKSSTTDTDRAERKKEKTFETGRNLPFRFRQECASSQVDSQKANKISLKSLQSQSATQKRQKAI